MYRKKPIKRWYSSSINWWWNLLVWKLTYRMVCWWKVLKSWQQHHSRRSRLKIQNENFHQRILKSHSLNPIRILQLAKENLTIKRKTKTRCSKILWKVERKVSPSLCYWRTIYCCWYSSLHSFGTLGCLGTIYRIRNLQEVW